MTPVGSPSNSSRLCREVQELLDAAGTPGLDQDASFAIRWDDDVFDGAVLIVLAAGPRTPRQHSAADHPAADLGHLG